MGGHIDWNAVSAIGQVVSAIATTIAIIVSLHLARRGERACLNIKCQIATTSPGNPDANFINISIANIGTRPERITSLGWASRKRGGRRLVFKPSQLASHDKLPAQVGPGEAVQFAWKAEDFAKCSEEIRDWSQRTRFLGFLYRPALLFVGTASGDEHRVRVSPNVHLLFATGDIVIFASHELRFVS